MSACMVTLKCLFIYLLIDSTFQINSNVVQLKTLKLWTESSFWKMLFCYIDKLQEYSLVFKHVPSVLN